ncbi:hypothetical protein C4D60_Mb09t18060 [Musa balbisiana]|uniref:Eukaryotic translation initiation factor 3 subunit J n=1 Tax=Musa balbisiana TaxID=52838 RepID=A0A4S8IHB9_MUSBA|nr:hypothetical protein C4D60_Mb09t18060 [Musa balbisiana]
MADWEEEDFEPAPPGLISNQPKRQWDDEDVEDENVKESWEDEEVPVQAPKLETKAAKPGHKGAGEKEKLPEAKRKADYKSTAELFAKKGAEKTLDSFIPKSESDFLEYALLLSHKICPYEKSFHYIGLLKAVIRLSMTSLKAADAKEVASSVTAIANEKLKQEKEATAGKKKQGTKKKQLHVDKAEDDYGTAGHYDDMDDYDFM